MAKAKVKSDSKAEVEAPALDSKPVEKKVKPSPTKPEAVVEKAVEPVAEPEVVIPETKVEPEVKEAPKPEEAKAEAEVKPEVKEAPKPKETKPAEKEQTYCEKNCSMKYGSPSCKSCIIYKRINK